MNKSITSGTTDEVRAKLLKHLEIYKANVASQEEEIKHMDELYQDLVDSVLNVRINYFKWICQKYNFFNFFQTLKCLPDTFNAHPDLQRLKQRLESEELTTPENGSKNGTRVNLERLQNQEQANLSLWLYIETFLKKISNRAFLFQIKTILSELLWLNWLSH